MTLYFDAATRFDALERLERMADARAGAADPKSYEAARKRLLVSAGLATEASTAAVLDPNRVSLAEQARRAKAAKG